MGSLLSAYLQLIAKRDVENLCITVFVMVELFSVFPRSHQFSRTTYQQCNANVGEEMFCPKKSYPLGI